MREWKVWLSGVLFALLACGVTSCDSGGDEPGWTGCVIDDTFYGDGQSNPSDACLVCDVELSSNSWSNHDGAGCDDGTFCNGADTCLGGACSEHAGDPCLDDGLYCNGTEFCDSDEDVCGHIGDPCTPPELCNEHSDNCMAVCVGCIIDGVCYDDGLPNPQNVCQICDISASFLAWTDDDKAACDDGEFCNGTDSCQGGACSVHLGDACTSPEKCFQDTQSCMIPEQHSQDLWVTSGHADSTSPAYNNWNQDVPPEVPALCAKCHTTPGFIDFVPDGVVSSSVPVGTVIDCDACHTDQTAGIARDLPSVAFPSGATADGLGPMSLCVACHQGRASTDSVDGMIASAGVGDDTPSSLIRFVKIHNTAAAATQFGTLVRGGYQYAGKSYDGRFAHADGKNDCMVCHDQHSLDADLDRCNQCHPGVTDPVDIRAYGSLVDYDGDGDISEGIYYEVQGVQAKLYSAIQIYANNVIRVPIGYDQETYPYFFTDSNDDGVIDPSEASYANRYTSFSPRLLRAAYNYHFSVKDPGCFAHGGKYTIELLYDSLEDLNSRIHGSVNMAGMSRIDECHFNGAAACFRKWDADVEVPSACALCHTPNGLPHFLKEGTTAAEAIPNGLFCSSCHTTPPDTYPVASVEFPSGDSADLGDSSNLCLLCHKGRASTISVDVTIAGSAGPYNFVSVHHSYAAAIFFGNETHGGYEYPGKVYAGRHLFANHMGRFDTCVECHKATNSLRVRQDSDHNSKRPNPEDCVYCHGQDISQPYPGADPARFKFRGIRPANIVDYDGDGNTSESLRAEIQGLEAHLYAQIQAYGFAIGRPVIFDLRISPYFFNDNNGNGLVDPGEAIYANRYRFNAAILKAAYNYYLSRAAPFGYIHNSRYMAQLMVDSIQNLGGNVSPYTWR